MEAEAGRTTKQTDSSRPPALLPAVSISALCPTPPWPSAAPLRTPYSGAAPQFLILHLYKIPLNPRASSGAPRNSQTLAALGSLACLLRRGLFGGHNRTEDLKLARQTHCH